MKKVKSVKFKLSETTRKKLLEERYNQIAKLTAEEVLSLYDFTLMVCSDKMPETYVTTYDVLLDNRENITKNLGVEIISLDEYATRMAEIVGGPN